MTSFDFPHCAFCDEPIDPRQLATFTLVQGWVESRSGGGAHSITMKKELGKYAHKLCIQIAQKTNQGEQFSLFDS